MPFERFLQWAGVGQLVLAAASTTFPFILGSRTELAKLRPLFQRLYWIYAGYILGCNVSFGLLSSLRPRWLLDASPLAGAVTGCIALYWGARLALQLVGFDRNDMPVGPRYRLAEAALTLLFAYLTTVYVSAFLANVRG
jgi:hypothetical protein